MGTPSVHLLTTLAVKQPKIPKISQREIAELVREQRAILLRLSAHIKSMDTKDREVPPCQDKKVLPIGYWQPADWFYDLLALGAKAERVASQPVSSS